MSSEIKPIIDKQLEFYRRGEAGCLFAAHASLNPERFEWQFSVSDPEKSQVEELIFLAVSDKSISTQSIIFPSVKSINDFKNFIIILKSIEHCSLEQEKEFLGSMCLGYRVRIGKLTSWVTGFGNFDFCPKLVKLLILRLLFVVSHDRITNM